MSDDLIENNNNTTNTQPGISPISKMKKIESEKSKIQSQYWIDHFKYKQNLINQLNILKNEKPEKNKKISQISSFSQEQELLCDNLYKMSKITNYSQKKLGKNYNEMKTSENKEEVQKKLLKEIFEKNLENIRKIEKMSEEIDEQTQLLDSWRDYIEKMKNDISSVRKENCMNIDNLCNKYSEGNKEFKKISKLYNLLLNITKFRVLNIEKEEGDPQCQKVNGYLLNSQNGNILNYNVKIKDNESTENKAIRVFNFWKALINLNKIEPNNI